MARLKTNTDPFFSFGEDTAHLFNDLVPPKEFERFDASIATDFCCPSCKYEWSGNAKPSQKEVAESEEE